MLLKFSPMASLYFFSSTTMKKTIGFPLLHTDPHPNSYAHSLSPLHFEILLTTFSVTPQFRFSLATAKFEKSMRVPLLHTDPHPNSYPHCILSVALYSAYRTYVPYSLFAFPDLEPRYRHRRHVISCITSLSLFPCVARLAFVEC